MPTQVFEPDEQLTAIAIGYKNDKENYIADKILPYIPVESAQFSYNEYPLEVRICFSLFAIAKVSYSFSI